MQEFPETRDSLIVQVRDPHNRDAWEQFASIYRPIIYRLARQRGLQDADAQDLAQQVLASVARSIDRWEKLDPPVRFRHWLRTVVRNAIVNALTRRPRDRATGGTSVYQQLLQEVDIDAESETRIELEYRRELYLLAAAAVQKEVRLNTWRAFELTVIQQVSAKQAAAELGRSEGSIYTARSRVVRKLRDAIKKLKELEL